MSPAQGMGGKVNGASDQYSVAVLAARLLSGHVLFDGESPIEILHVNAPPPSLETANAVCRRTSIRRCSGRSRRRASSATSVGAFVEHSAARVGCHVAGSSGLNPGCGVGGARACSRALAAPDPGRRDQYRRRRGIPVVLFLARAPRAASTSAGDDSSAPRRHPSTVRPPRSPGRNRPGAEAAGARDGGATGLGHPSEASRRGGWRPGHPQTRHRARY
jgi:hypothetical protein